MMFISQKLFNGSLVATVIALGQSSSSSSLVCVSTITIRLQGKYRRGTSTAPFTQSLLALLQLLRSLQVVNTSQTAFSRYSQWAPGDTGGSHLQIQTPVVVPGPRLSTWVAFLKVLLFGSELKLPHGRVWGCLLNSVNFKIRLQTKPLKKTN